MLNVEQKVKLHNYFEFYKNGEQIAQAHNIVLNRFYNEFLLTYSYDRFDGIVLGSGSGVPTPDRTDLFSRFGSKAGTSTKSIISDDLMTVKYTATYVLGLTDYVGQTISEIGIYISSASKPVTHAMLKDMEGNPIQITKTDLDTLTITATLYFTLDASSLNDSISVMGQARIGGNPSSFTCRADPAVHGDFSISTTTVRSENAITVTAPVTRIPKERLVTDVGITNMCLGPLLYQIHSDDNFPFQRLENQPLGTGDGVTTGFNSDFYGCCDPVVYVDGVVVTNYICNPYVLTTRDGARNSINISGFLPRVDDKGNVIDAATSVHQGVYRYWINTNPDIFYFNRRSTTCLMETSDNINGPWTELKNGEYINTKYMRAFSRSTSSVNVYLLYNKPGDYNIIFDNPPAEGSVITIDYTPRCIPKNDKNVVDISASWRYTY